MAPALQGCCGLSLRTCTIILAAVNLAYSVAETSLSVALEVISSSGHAEEAFREEDFPDFSGEHHYNRSERSYEDSDPLNSEEIKEMEEQYRQFREQYQPIILAVNVFNLITIVLVLANLISLSVLIYGAVKSKTACIRQWLVVGGLIIVNDILFSLVLLCLGVELLYALSPLLDTPLSIWLWIVAMYLYDRCREMDGRNASSPLSMAALLENGDAPGDGVSPCTVAYSEFR